MTAQQRLLASIKTPVTAADANDAGQALQWFTKLFGKPTHQIPAYPGNEKSTSGTITWHNASLAGLKFNTISLMLQRIVLVGYIELDLDGEVGDLLMDNLDLRPDSGSNVFEIQAKKFADFQKQMRTQMKNLVRDCSEVQGMDIDNDSKKALRRALTKLKQAQAKIEG